MSRNVKGGRLKIESRSQPLVSVIEINDKGGENTSMKVWLSEEESGECWAGHLQTRDISNWVEKTRMEYKQYVQETVSALTGQGDFIIELVTKEEDEGAELRWKKRVTQDGIVLRMGSAHVQRRTSSGEALEACVGRVAALEEELSALRGRCEGLEEERTGLAEQMERRCQQQRRTETQLFTKFALVLNEKKKMIAELQKSTPANASPPPEAKPEIVPKKVPAKKKPKKVKEEFCLDERESSDDADMQPIVTRKRSARTRTQPAVASVASTSKKTLRPEEEELYGGETQPMDTQDLLDDF